MDEDLQVKPTLRERLLYELPVDAAVFGIALWLLNRYALRDLFIALVFFPAIFSGIVGRAVVDWVATRRWERDANAALKNATSTPPADHA
jgi:hypothetical protein